MYLAKLQTVVFDPIRICLVISLSNRGRFFRTCFVLILTNLIFVHLYNLLRPHLRLLLCDAAHRLPSLDT